MNVRQFLSIVEIRTKLVSLSSLTIGLIIAWISLHQTAPSVSFPWGLFALMAAATLAIDMGTTAFNSFFDYWNGTDRKGRNAEKDKVLVHEGTPSGLALLTGLGLFLVAGGLGLMLGILRGWEVCAIGALCMAVGFFYSGGPRPIATTPVGEVFAGGFLGSVLIGLTVYVCTGNFSGTIALASLPSTLMIASILTVNNTCDLVSDKAAGRRTLSILIGLAASRILVLVLAGLAYLTGAVYLVAGGATLAVLPLVGGIGLSIPTYLAMFKRGFGLATKGPNMGAISRCFLLFSLAYATALLVAGWR